MVTKVPESLALQRKAAPQNEIEQGIVLARQKGISPVDLLLSQKGYSEEGLADGFAEWLNIPRVRIASLTVDADATKAISESIALKYQCLPLKIEGKRLVMAMANPADYDAIQDVQFVSGFSVQPVVATRAEILDGIEEMYRTDELMQEFLSKVSDTADFSVLSDDSDNLNLDQSGSRSAADQVPVVKMCNLILQEAIRSQCSDVHLEPTLNCLKVRMRIDGVLREYIDVPKWLHMPLVSRIKILASMDIAERRVPQDGRFKVRLQEKSADLRVSTIPSLFGEKVVLRILGTMSIPELESMGFSEWQLSTLKDCLSQPQGLILLTGPTGSGKTTTLYSMLSRRRSSEINIVTVEDPVEYQLEGINQIPVNTRGGLTFASTLRSILRQDPDVILIGEIRDLETAEIAFQAANTGHLVLSTLHTDDAFGAVLRLLDLGIDRSLISASLSLVVAQRLARKVCQQCKEPYTPSSEVMQKLRIEDPEVEFYRGKGCPACRKMGYSGRAGIYEMLRVTNTIKELIRLKSSENILRRAATVAGTKTLLEDGISKACNGVTNPDELARVIEVVAEETFPCPKCASMVSLEFKSCPFCAFTLRNTCHACGQELNAKWTVCPYCSTAVGGPAGTDAGAKGAAPMPRLLSSSSVNSEARQPSGNLPESTVAETKCPRIVIADDDENILKIVTATLRQLPLNVEVLTAADGMQALELIQSKGADLAILDLKMPGLDGFQVCERLRQDIRTAFLPILMLTANSDQENRTKGFLIGTDDFMAKPFDVTEFLARVTRLLRRTYGV